ncbi:hypothetical protein SAMN04488127_0264 [Bhargavaea ginsengi]|uniref:Uncharacterized protein n=1 Tax=Bhargavaea ginsengi TaxID=426757 RepID=A0A1H6SUD6_9BACL|nr:hypothetical protein SAMN04488127_0264 [Bhargavaea ginsengi]
MCRIYPQSHALGMGPRIPVQPSRPLWTDLKVQYLIRLSNYTPAPGKCQSRLRKFTRSSVKSSGSGASNSMYSPVPGWVNPRMPA